MIHRYWAAGSPGPPPADPWLGAVIANLHPGQVVRDWTDDTIPGRLRHRLDADPLTADPRHRANVARWWLLARHGGIWLDHDVIPLRPLPDGAWTARLDQRCGCAVRVPLGHELPSAMLDAIEAAPRTERSRPVDVSGDRLLHRVAAGYLGLGSHPLPFDAAGRPVIGATPWAVHLWSTSSTIALQGGQPWRSSGSPGSSPSSGRSSTS